MTTSMRDRILYMCNGIPVPSLIKFIQEGTVTIEDLRLAGLMPARIKQIEIEMHRAEEIMWRAALNGTVANIIAYIKAYPDGRHVLEARALLLAKEDEFWEMCEQEGTPEAMNRYLAIFPQGKHVNEAMELISDPDWAETKRIGTIEAYEEYARTHPGMHTEEIRNAILALTDDADWQEAMRQGTTKAYNDYLNKHTNGKYVEAARRIVESRQNRDGWLNKLRYDDTAFIFTDEIIQLVSDGVLYNDEVASILIDKVTKDVNAVSAQSIKKLIDNNVITREQVCSVFGEEKTAAICNFRGMVQLGDPYKEVMYTPEFQRDTTEVYFWGTPSSGKTCALGALLSGAHKNYCMEAQECPSYDYLNKLKNLFRYNGVSTLPSGTMVSAIEEMILVVKDKKDRKYRLTFVDIAGEIFRTLYLQGTGQMVDEEKAVTLTHLKGYLGNKNNRKISFFVVEYGAHDVEWDGVPMGDYLARCSLYMKNNKILRSSTNAVYIIVTKCDRIPNYYNMSRKEVAEAALDYVKTYLGSFYENLKEACKEAGVADMKVVSFSVGDVFAQQLCYFNDEHTAKVLDLLLERAQPVRKGFINWLNG